MRSRSTDLAARRSRADSVCDSSAASDAAKEATSASDTGSSGEAQADELPTLNGVSADAWGAAFDQAMDEALEAWRDDTLLTRDLVLPFGTFPGPLVARIYVLELVVHSWDLAAATGQRSILDDDLADSALPTAGAMLPPAPRGGEMPFGPVIAVADDRPVYDRLAGYLGRQPV